MASGPLIRRLRQITGRYRYFLIVVLAGVLLMVLPQRKTPEKVPEMPEKAEAALGFRQELEAELSAMLSLSEGAGTVRVLLTEARGEQVRYQCDEDMGAGDRRSKTVLVRSTDRQETGLIRQIDPPSFQGALVLCQGGDRAAVRLAIVNAVTSVTGLSADRVTVLKMK